MIAFAALLCSIGFMMTGSYSLGVLAVIFLVIEILMLRAERDRSSQQAFRRRYRR